MADEGIYRRAESRVFHQDLLGPLEMGEANCGRLQHVVCRRAGYAAEGLALKVRRESEDLKVAHVLTGLPASLGRLGL